MGKFRRGLPKSYIKKWGISKLAWRKFRAGALTKGIRTRTKAIKRRIRRARRGRNPARRRGVRRMVRRYRRRRRRGGKSMTRTAFKLIRLGALAAPALAHGMRRDLDTREKIITVFSRYTGYRMDDGTFHSEYLAEGWGPYIMACVATYGIPKLVGIIRRL